MENSDAAFLEGELSAQANLTLRKWVACIICSFELCNKIRVHHFPT